MTIRPRHSVARSLAFSLAIPAILAIGLSQAAQPATVLPRQTAFQARDFFDFKLFKGNDPVKIGDILLTLRAVDKNAQKYTVDLYVGATRHEKKDVYAGEPIYFYLGNDQEPHELLVRQVFEDHIEGRLAAPKAAKPAPAN